MFVSVLIVSSNTIINVNIEQFEPYRMMVIEYMLVFMVYMVENRVRTIFIIIVSIFLLEKEAHSKELSMSIQLGGVTNYYYLFFLQFFRQY